MGYFTGTKARVGHRAELRSSLLTHGLRKPKDLHRVEEYVNLLSGMYKGALPPARVRLELPEALPRTDAIVLNINSEAQSRRFPEATAVAIGNALLEAFPNPLVLVGAPSEAAHTQEVARQLSQPQRVENAAGNTTLPELARLLGTAAAVVSTDSGPAHLANALGTPTIACFSAGKEGNTGPFNAHNSCIIRSEVDCQCAVSNTCKLGTPPCLLGLEPRAIVEKLRTWLQT